MGKYLKTPMDHKIIDYLSIELFKLDPDNKYLNKFMSMKTEEGYHITKTINAFKKTNELPTGYNTDGSWKESY
jgi:hypothetical protein|tara:strand:- start:486 stop:704 length:219 start_codon:yes stop_codon:yes gene_type:complete